MNQGGEVESSFMQSDDTTPSIVSLRSDQSIGRYEKFKNDGQSEHSSFLQSDDTAPSTVSLRSDQSIGRYEKLKNDGQPEHSSSLQSDDTTPSTLSLKSDYSILQPPDFKNDGQPEHSMLQDASASNKNTQPKTKLSENTEIKNESSEVPKNPTLVTFKLNMVKKYQHEESANNLTQTLLRSIFTELEITEGENEETITEHEMGQIEASSNRQTTELIKVKCNDIFKPSSGQNKCIRTVLTKGVAGIGKTISVQKFILDWAEEKANSDIHLIFPLPFKELNLLKDKTLSLNDLLQIFFADKLVELPNRERNIIFIFDGLDECRLPLNFRSNRSLSDVFEEASVDVLLTNLIMGNLLPSALIWITSRPAAAAKIPSEYIDRVTDVQGFNDMQKEEYFKKKMSDPSLADMIITSIKEASMRNLHAMCNIPVFCWILASIVEETPKEEIPKALTQMYTQFLVIQAKRQEMKGDLLLKLGQLAFHQLMEYRVIFYEADLSDCGINASEISMLSGVCKEVFKEVVVLNQQKVYSFVHLSIQEHLAALYVHVMFVKHNRNVLDQSLLWKFKTLVMKDNGLLALHKSAVDKALTYENGHLDLFLQFLLGLSLESNQALLEDTLKLVGGITHSNEKIAEYIKNKIRGNLPVKKSINLFNCLNELGDSSLVEEIQRHLQSGKIKNVKLSSSYWSALVFVLLTSEEKLEGFQLIKYTGAHHKPDEVLLKLLPVVKASRRVTLSHCDLSNNSWEILASVLSSGRSNLRELNLSWNHLEASDVKVLSNALGNANCKLETLKLASCYLEAEDCQTLASVIRSNLCHLRTLDLSNNEFEDEGVKHLCTGLKDPNCQLKKLKLVKCKVKAEACAALASALSSNPSHLRELDLSENEVGDSGVKHLSSALENPLCELEELRLWRCSITEEGCDVLASYLRSNPSHLKQLDLSMNTIQDSGLILLCKVLEKPQCKLEILRIRYCELTDEGGSALISYLNSNPAHLIELNLSGNELEATVKQLARLRDDSHYRLEKVTFCKEKNFMEL